MAESQRTRRTFGRVRRGQVVVQLYTRQGCGLCRRAENLIAREARGSLISTIDVDTDEILVDRYGVRVPVVVVDGREIAAFELGPGVVKRAVRAARWERRRSSA